MMFMIADFLLEAKTAPLTCGGSVLIAAVELDILHGVTETELVDSHASGDVGINLDDWKSIDKLFGVGSVGLD